MFCPNCGTEIPDSSIVCPSCGGNVAESNNQAPGSGVTSMLEGKDNKTILAIVAAAAAVVIIILAVIISTAFGSSYKTPIKKMVKLINKKTESSIDYLALNNAPYDVTYYKTRLQILDKNDDYTDCYGKSKDAYEDMIDELEEEFGDDYKIKIEKIKNVDKIDKDDLKDVQEDLREEYEDKDDIEDAVEEMEETLEDYEDEYDLSSKDSKKILKAYEKSLKAQSKAKVTSGYEITVEFKIKGEDGHANYKAKNIEVYKINGKWVTSLSPWSLCDGLIEDND